jgi:hypothetical protein
MLRVAVVLAVTTAPAAQQGRTVDEGWFTLRVNGEQVGREQFLIRQAPVAGGVNVVAKATIAMSGGRRLSPALTADSGGHPISYSFEVQANGQVESLRATAAGGRYMQQVRTPSGLSERELRLEPGTIILDQDIVHQYYFVGRSRGGGRVPVIAPRTLARDVVTITVRGDGPVELRNGTVPATHLIVTNAAGVATDLWVDAAGRVLRVATPARHFEAERDEPPR